MSLIAIPAFTAIVLKVALLWVERDNLSRQLPLVCLLIGLFMMNIIEFSSFYLPGENKDNFVWLLQAYYLFCSLAAVALLELSLRGAGVHQSKYSIINLVVALVAAVMVSIPNVTISGVETMGALVRRVPGPALGLWNAYVVTLLLAGSFLLFKGYRHAECRAKRRYCLALITGLLPMAFAAAAIIFLMSLDVRINAVIIFPLLGSFLMLVLLRSETKYGTFSLLSKVPGTEENSGRRRVAALVATLQKDLFTEGQEKRHQEILDELEHASLQLALLAQGGNKSKTARALGISSATLHRRFRAARLRDDSDH